MKGRTLHIAGAVAAVAAGALLVFLLIGVYDRSAPGREPVLFRVEAGESFSSVKRRLGREGLIDHPRAIGLYALLKRYDRRVKVGTYRLEYGERAKNVLGVLVRGEVHRVAVTIPEGLMAREIARALEREAQVDSAGFAATLSDSELATRVGAETGDLEGYLFPDTYWVAWESPPRQVTATMVRRFEEVFDADARNRAEAIGMTLHEVVTLASIVQAEARLNEELRLVSAVYHNRLRIGMRLEADPTVAYAMGGYRGRLFYRDLEIDSPYNTYKHDGLPPGPICNPGEGALMAALYPDTTCDAIYFVAEGNGGHIFSRTLSDHLDAVQKVRRQRRRGNTD